MARGLVELIDYTPYGNFTQVLRGLEIISSNNDDKIVRGWLGKIFANKLKL